MTHPVAAPALLRSTTVTRALAPPQLLLPLALSVFPLVLGCAGSKTTLSSDAPTLRTSPAALHARELGLPFHRASIVDLALLPPAANERWRLASGDLDGEVRFWADGKLLAAWPAHPGGLSVLVAASDGTLYTAGFDGRVREWPVGATEPARTFSLGRPVTALAVSDSHFATSDGRYVQLWTRAAEPELAWSTIAHSFVTGLTLSASGSVIAAAELRDAAMREATAMHPLAKFNSTGLRAIGPQEEADLRYLAARDFPGAVADYVEVWQPNHDRKRELIPRATIGSDLGIIPEGGVVYREIYGPEQAAMVGRRLQDLAHVPISLVKPWALFSGQAEVQDPNAPRRPVPVGDFVLGPGGEVIVVDQFPGWDQAPPAQGWRAGPSRELAIGYGFAALGDGAGNLAVVELAQPFDPGWLNPGIERPELIAAASTQPWVATASLEPRTQYRLWSLTDGIHGAIRVEAPSAVLVPAQANAAGLLEAPMYPVAISLASGPGSGDAGATFATSLSNFSEPHQAAVRMISLADGSPTMVTLAPTPKPIEIALTPDANQLLAWTSGFEGFSWTGPAWATASGSPSPTGAPYVSANGRFSAHVSTKGWLVVDRESNATLAAMQTNPGEPGTVIPTAIANDGTLAIVELFGGGVVVIVDVSGVIQTDDGAVDPSAVRSRSIELPGAATALAWVDDRAGQPQLIIGFQDGSIVRVDREAGTTQPIHAGTGGRVWTLAPLGGRAGVYVELDDRGLSLHRFDDDASVDLYLGDATTLARSGGSPPQPASGVDLVALWRPGTAMPVCAIFDGSRAGVIAPAAVHRLGPPDGSAFFEVFASGQPCPGQPAPTPVEPEPTPVEPEPVE